ncbi:hypothetical protein ABZY68_25660 [Streptomyces sp. NPDC006482]|uniref:hypothetical protein n=1 Tax=Streptomyces sp. NPDC006482 TaxID=3154306 RepID=UPI0033AC8661
MQHTATLVIGNGGRPGVIDHTDVTETCFACADADAAHRGPCEQGPGTLAIGSLVQTLPAPRWTSVPFRTAIVLNVHTAPGTQVLALWFWALGGLPRIGVNVFAATNAEIRPMLTTAATLPKAARQSLINAAHTATTADAASARFIAPIASVLGL